MRRREFLTLLGGAAAWPIAVRAQPSSAMRRIGLLMGFAENSPDGQRQAGALRKGLEELHWVDGRNMRIDLRWAGGCVSAWNKDPVFGVIGIQSGPRG
jgi:putative ABC transport system substrate-binding protein